MNASTHSFCPKWRPFIFRDDCSMVHQKFCGRCNREAKTKWLMAQRIPQITLEPLQSIRCFVVHIASSGDMSMVSKQQTYQNKTNPSDNTSHTILQNGVIELPILDHFGGIQRIQMYTVVILIRSSLIFHALFGLLIRPVSYHLIINQAAMGLVIVFTTRPLGPWGDLRGEKFAPPCRRFSRSKFGADGLVEMQGGWVMSEDMADMLKLFGVWKSQIRKNGLGDCPYTIHGSGIFTYTWMVDFYDKLVISR